MSKQDASDLLVKLTPLKMTYTQALFCFGMSKMTTVNESEESNKYKRLQFVEFLEMIGRAADQKFKDTEMEGELSLAEKIENILDDLFTIVDFKRRDVQVMDEVLSESDDEY